MINIIVAIAENNAIGKDNKLPWHLRQDLQYFKQTTLGAAVIMGRKTWDSLTIKPLPRRLNVVLTRNPYFNVMGVPKMESIEEVIHYASHVERCFVIGGAEVYKAFLPLAERLYVTKVYKSFPADAFFPEIDPEIWAVEEESELHYDESEDLNFKFIVYKRKEQQQ